VSCDYFWRRWNEAESFVETSVSSLLPRTHWSESVVQGMEYDTVYSGLILLVHRRNQVSLIDREAFLSCKYTTFPKRRMRAGSSFFGDAMVVLVFVSQVEAVENWKAQVSFQGLTSCSVSSNFAYPRYVRRRFFEACSLVVFRGPWRRYRHSVAMDGVHSLRHHEFEIFGDGEDALNQCQTLQLRAQMLNTLLGLPVGEAADAPPLWLVGLVLLYMKLIRSLMLEAVNPFGLQPSRATTSGECHEDQFGLALSLDMSTIASAFSTSFGLDPECVALMMFPDLRNNVDQWLDIVWNQMLLRSIPDGQR